MCLPFHVRTDKDPVSETLSSLAFAILDEDEVQNPSASEPSPAPA
jgi:hypothetical protein